MSRRQLRRGEAHMRLVVRVIAMRVAIGDQRAWMHREIARLFGVPLGLIMGRRDLRLSRRRDTGREPSAT
jgi:hypothetical protein